MERKAVFAKEIKEMVETRGQIDLVWRRFNNGRGILSLAIPGARPIILFTNSEDTKETMTKELPDFFEENYGITTPVTIRLK